MRRASDIRVETPMSPTAGVKDPVTGVIIAAAIEVHKALGPGLLESAYQKCLEIELQVRGIEFRSQVELPIEYKGHRLDCGYRIDLLIDEKVIVELKTVESLAPIHEAQLLTYLRLSGVECGLLLNFNAPYLRDGIKRLILSHK